MTLATIVLAALVGLVADEDPRELVGRLGAARFADREAAATALREIGGDALDALRDASDDDDPEIAARASALLEQITSRLMVQPTMVRLDYHDQTLAEIARDLGQKADVELKLMPENDPRWTSRRVTIEAEGPVPLWRAVEEVCRVGGLQVNQTFQMVGMGGAGAPATRQTVMNLMPSPYGQAPNDVQGPFLVSATKVDYQRTRVLGPGAQNMGMLIQPNGVAVPARRNLAQAAGEGARAVPGLTEEAFSLQLELLAEPRMSIVQEGALKLVEAVDEKGQSLLPPEASSTMVRYAAYNGLNINGTTMLQLPVSLQMPASPGKWIKRLRATVPIVVLARKEPAMVVPLDQVGKTFEGGEVKIQIHEVKRDPMQPFTLIELTAKLVGPNHDHPGQTNVGAEMMVFRSNNGTGPGQVEIVDAQGRTYPQWFPFTASSGPDGTRMTLRLLPAQEVGPPVAIRYHEMTRAATEVTFELHDVPMP